MRFWIFYLIGCCGLLGCTPRPSVQIEQGDLLYRETFDTSIGWDNRRQGAVSVGVEGSAYRIRADVNQFVMGFGVGPYDDVIIEVDASQLSAHQNNAYGVACRASIADGNTNGYYFLIGGDGTASLRIGQFTEIRALIAWQSVNAVNKGVALNRLRVICAGDYLALYANDTLLMQTRDSTYRTGYIGFLASAARDGTIEVAFDNLFIYEAKLP